MHMATFTSFHFQSSHTLLSYSFLSLPVFTLLNLIPSHLCMAIHGHTNPPHQPHACFSYTIQLTFTSFLSFLTCLKLHACMGIMQTRPSSIPISPTIQSSFFSYPPSPSIIPVTTPHISIFHST